MKSLGILYDDDGYVETPGQPLSEGQSSRTGLFGRQVAGKEFLHGLFTHGIWERLVAVVRNRPSAETLTRAYDRYATNDRQKRELLLVPDETFLDAFHPDPPARLLYTPCPPDIRYAWARRHRSSDAFALCGVTHTLCSQRAFEWLGQLLIGPFEPYDALICTSTAVERMVRATTAAYADYLRERVGGDPRVRMRLEVIPLGVDTARYHPASPEERSARREALGIRPDEVAILFVGRLSHHTKAHPFPLFHAAEHAALATGRKVHILLSGWAHNPAVLKAFQDGAVEFAPNVRVTFVDGTRPEHRETIWHAADIFSSLSDNIQETFGLVVVEAMASGLPVVASDWDGYRDLVTDGETGLLVPTLMVPGATADAGARLILETHSYEHFLAECSQAVAVDSAAAAAAFTRLVADESERRRLGAAGRRTALLRFAWAEVIRAYECLWGEQEQTRLEVVRLCGGRTDGAGMGLYPSPEVAFESYPTRWMLDGDRFAATPDAGVRLNRLLAMPLVTHAEWARHTDVEVLTAVLAAADGRTLTELEAAMSRAGVGKARATIAWMLKYDLIRPTDSSNST